MIRSITLPIVFLVSSLPAPAEERRQSFDRDPGWEGVNNRAAAREPRVVRQDFGHSPVTSHTGPGGEVGGLVTAAAETAYYALKIPPKTLNDPLTASGTFTPRGRVFHVLLAFFNADTVNEWRTPNSLALRLNGRGDVFYAYVEYCTGRWRAGGDSPRPFAIIRDPKTGRSRPKGFPIGRPIRWSITYDPNGNAGAGSLAVTLGDETAVCHLEPGHRADGATFNRFGLLPVLKSADDPGEVWFGGVTVNGRRQDFGRDPGWEGVNNRRTYTTTHVRPRCDFGFSPTRHAGGKAAGELGGLVFRGDCRFRASLAAYGDRLEPLTLDKPLRAAGKIALRRGVTDSTTLLGFYHSSDSLRANPAQDSGWPKNFLGIAVEGPSREGFMVYPACRAREGGGSSAKGDDRPHILPDGSAHDWSLEYDPAASGGLGRITVLLDGRPARMDLGKGDKATGTRLDRFGLVTTWIDGNGQNVYFDDLSYTWRQE